jgi:hypothetical protein
MDIKELITTYFLPNYGSLTLFCSLLFRQKMVYSVIQILSINVYLIQNKITYIIGILHSLFYDRT